MARDGFIMRKVYRELGYDKRFLTDILRHHDEA